MMSKFRRYEPMLRLITDFDGPIMNISDRYYHVYKLCLAQTRRVKQPITILSKQEFWDLKRSRIPESQIALKSGLDEEQAEMFVKIRHQNAHNMSLLVYDQPVTGAVEALQTCQKSGIDLVVMTMRRQRELDEALHRCHFRKFFTKNRRYCIGDNYHKTKDIHDKPLLMANAIASLPPASKTWMVGDTEADIISAQSQGIPIIAVLSGIRDRAQLEKYKPDLILNNLAESVEFILSENLSKVG